MSGARPNSDTARRMGMVPFTGDSNGSSQKNGSGNYPNINSNKSGDFAGYPAPPEKGRTSNQGGNNQLWSNGSGVSNQGSAPAWPNNQQGAPMNASKGFNKQAAGAPGPVGGGGGGGGYIEQGSRPGGNGSSAPQQQQQGQAPNWQGQNVSEGVPVPPYPDNTNWQSKQGGGGNAPAANGSQQQLNWQNQQGGGGYAPTANGSQQQPNSQNKQGGGGNYPAVNGSQQQPNLQNKQGGGGNYSAVNGPQQQPNRQGSQGAFLTQGPQKGAMPKGDYVYYDGNGNQIQPDTATGPPGGPTGNGTGSGSERHFHHHYYYNQQQQAQQAAPVGYPYDKKMEEKKKRKPGATALAAALITCWACTCCCHAPCGF